MLIGNGICSSKSDPFVRRMIRILFVLCHLFPGLVGVSVELHTQKKQHVLIRLCPHLLYLSDKEHVAFVILWAMTGGAARTSDFTHYIHMHVCLIFAPPPNRATLNSEQERKKGQPIQG